MKNKLVDKKIKTKPIKQIDYKKLDAMCAIQCTGEECASILGMDYDTLNAALKRDGNTGFSDYFKIKSATGKMSLRRKQYNLAESGNATMLIWLGKQWLGQCEKHDDKTQEEAQPLKINFTVNDAKSEISVTRGISEE